MALGNNHVSAISSEIFKFVRIHPNFASRPVWCEKMSLCCFYLKAGRKDLTNRPKALSHPPPPPPLGACPEKVLNLYKRYEHHVLEGKKLQRGWGCLFVKIVSRSHSIIWFSIWNMEKCYASDLVLEVLFSCPWTPNPKAVLCHMKILAFELGH